MMEKGREDTAGFFFENRLHELGYLFENSFTLQTENI